MAETPTKPRSREQALRESLLRGYPIRLSYEVFEETGIPGADHFLLMAAVLRANENIHANLKRALRPHGLSVTQYMMLANLHLRGPHRSLLLGRLAKRMLVHPTTITLKLDKLEERGLVARKRHPTDRRGVLVSITEVGCAMLVDVHRDLAKGQFGAPGMSSEAALTVVAGLMSQIEGDVESAADDLREDVDPDDA